MFQLLERAVIYLTIVCFLIAGDLRRNKIQKMAAHWKAVGHRMAVEGGETFHIFAGSDQVPKKKKEGKIDCHVAACLNNKGTREEKYISLKGRRRYNGRGQTRFTMTCHPRQPSVTRRMVIVHYCWCQLYTHTHTHTHAVGLCERQKKIQTWPLWLRAADAFSSVIDILTDIYID